MDLSQIYAIENDLIADWFNDSANGKYKEPLLDTKTVKILKSICDDLDQNLNIFLMSLEIVEDYIRAKTEKKQKINDPILVLIVAVFLANKYIGHEETIKISQLIDILHDLTKKLYKSTTIFSLELEILNCLNGKLPITTIVDDLDTIIAKLVLENRLGVNLQSLCYSILEYLYMIRDKWFFELKSIYNCDNNEDCLIVFKNLITSKYYLPACILISALSLTNCRHILNIDGIINDISIRFNIHKDHFIVLVTKFVNLVQ